MLLALDTWRQIVTYHPLHFWQLAHPQLAPVVSGCDAIVRQYAWQSPMAVGRDEIMRAIAEAERKLRVTLGYSVGARAVAARAVLLPDGTARLTGEGQIQAVGQPVLQSLGDPSIMLSDRDGDGIPDTFSATIATGLTADPAAAVVALVADADRVRNQRSDWRIWPITVTTTNPGAGYLVTVTGNAWQIVRPAAYEGISAGVLDPTDTAIYLSRLTIAHQTIDATRAIVLADGTALPGQLCRGQLALPPNAWPAGCGVPLPAAITAHVVAGAPLGDDGDLDPFWQPIVSRLAAAEIAGKPCACDAANQWLYHWQFDVSRVRGGEEEFAFKEAAMNNPFGTRRGHIAAWNAIRELSLPHGFRI